MQSASRADELVDLVANAAMHHTCSSHHVDVDQRVRHDYRGPTLLLAPLTDRTADHLCLSVSIERSDTSEDAHSTLPVDVERSSDGTDERSI